MVIGEVGFPPITGLKWRSHSSLNRPMLKWTRFNAPTAPTESAPSFRTWGVKTVAGFSKKAVSGPSLTKSLNCLLSSPPPASVSLPPYLPASSRAPSSYTAFCVRGLLMLSVETSDVSIAPGRKVWTHW